MYTYLQAKDQQPVTIPAPAVDCTALYTEIENMRDEVAARDILIAKQKTEIADLQVKMAIYTAGIDMAIDESATYLRRRNIGIDDLARITAIRAGLVLTVARVDGRPAWINEWIVAASCASTCAA